MRQIFSQIWRALTSWEFWVSLAIISGSALGVIIAQLRREGITWEQVRFVIVDNLPTINFPDISLVVHSSDNDYTILALMLMLTLNSWVVYLVIREMRD